MAIPVLIDQTVLNDIKALVERSRLFVVPYKAMKKFSEGKLEGGPKFLNSTATITIPVYRQVELARDDIIGRSELGGVEWTATFTLEEHMPKVPFRHLSVACSVRTRGPRPEAMQMFMEYFGFVNQYEKTKVWIEKFPNDQGFAVNVIEPIDGDWNSQSPRKVVGLRYDPRIAEFWDANGRLRIDRFEADRLTRK